MGPRPTGVTKGALKRRNKKEKEEREKEKRGKEGKKKGGKKIERIINITRGVLSGADLKRMQAAPHPHIFAEIGRLT